MKFNLTTILDNSPFFGGIDPDTVQLIIKHAKIRTKKTNQYFFKEHDIANSMFILLDGSVEIQKIWRDKHYPISQLFSGDCFGEMAIIDHCPRSASVMVKRSSQALELDIDCFSQIYQKDIKQYTMIHMNMGREVSRRLREANELLFRYKIANDLGGALN